jgi:hypothetical protein
VISNPLSDREIRANFDKAIKAAVELGQMPPSDQGFDEWTNDAIVAVAQAYPKTNPSLVRKARQEINGQLSGEHTTRREAMLRAALDAIG